MEYIIRTENLTKTFYRGRNRIEAVKNANLSIEKGEAVGIIGPSGAGKSTLLHILGGLDTPTNGIVYFENLNLYRISESQRARIRNKRIGFVFQFYHLLPEFTVLENVIMPALISGIRDQGSGITLRKKAEMMLGRMDLSHRLNHKPRELSGGETQRVAIARALINGPDVLLCDEPTGNLDSNMSEQIYGILYDIHQNKKMTMVVVTHDKTYLSRFNRIYHIIDGTLSEVKNVVPAQE